MIFGSISLPSTTISCQAYQLCPNLYIALSQPRIFRVKASLARLSRLRERDTLTANNLKSSVVRARIHMTECLADPKRGRSYQHQPQSIKLRQALNDVKRTKSTTQQIRGSSVSNRALGSMTEYITLPLG